MTINFYINNSDENTVSKNLTEYLTIEGTLKDETSVTEPVFIIENDSFPDCNYCFIEEFGRFYFITNITSFRKNLWKITLSVDVLMSFNEEIRNQKAIIDKQERQQNSNTFINDGSFVTESKEYIETKQFTNGFNENGEFVLITAGGVSNASTN